MDKITNAYILVHGECPGYEPASTLWYHDKDMFLSGWACCLGAQEELEIEKDVHYQREGLQEGR